MRMKNYLSTVTFVFLVIAVGHFWRAITATKVMFGQTVIPLWVSWVVVVAALYLCYQAYKLRS